jgi:hypothetical protein
MNPRVLLGQQSDGMSTAFEGWLAQFLQEVNLVNLEIVDS